VQIIALKYLRLPKEWWWNNNTSIEDVCGWRISQKNV